jgi:hypothetical protein
MRFLLLILLIGVGLIVGNTVFAQEAIYQPLVDLPRLDADQQSTEEYVNALYLLSITVAAFLAFVKILYGGIKWMFSDVVTSKESAKNDIKGALFGLLIVVSAVLILNTINTDLTNLNIFGDAPSIAQTQADQEEEGEEAPLVDAEIGDSIITTGSSPEEIAHFNETCPGVINPVLDSGGSVGFSCDEATDQVNSLSFTCTGNTCVCDPGNAGTSVCVSRCRLDGPEGAEYANYANQADGSILCTYIVEAPATSCADTPYTSCMTNAVGGMGCEASQDTDRICRTESNGPTTYFYGFAE